VLARNDRRNSQLHGDGSLTTGAFHAASSAYHAKFGERVIDQRLSLIDDPAYRAGAMRRRITCEGIPTRRLEMIRDGHLVGLLSSIYDSTIGLLNRRAARRKNRPTPPTRMSISGQSRLPPREEGAVRFD